MRKLQLTVILILLVWQSCWAQRILKRPIGKISMNDYYGQRLSDRKTEKLPWIVFSDEVQIINGREYQLMDKFFVVDEDLNRLHLYEDPNYQGGRKLSGSSIDLGWVDKSKLVLSNKCIKYSTTNVDRKALIVYTPEALSEIISDIRNGRNNDNLVKFFESPSLNSGVINFTELYGLLFVYKTRVIGGSTWYLLGENYMFNPTHNREKFKVLGWVNSNFIHTWDHRVALEHNWDDSAFRERARNGNKEGRIYDILPSLQAKRVLYREDPVSSKILKTNENRFNRNFMRFPIIKDRGSSYEVAFFDSARLASTGEVLPQTTIENIKAIIEEKKQDLERINITFVVDATKSMATFYPDIVLALKESKKKILDEFSHKHIRINTVLYRDEREGTANMLEASGPNEAIQLLEKYVNPTSFVGPNSNDPDFPEAVYYGMQQAFEKGFFTEGFSNILVLIGDAGDHYHDQFPSYRRIATVVPPEEISDLLARFRCEVLLFQTSNLNDPKTGRNTYLDFIREGRNLLLDAAQKRIEIKKSLATQVSEDSVVQTPMGFGKKKITSSDFYSLLIYPPTRGTQEDPEKLTVEIPDFVLNSTLLKEEIIYYLQGLLSNSISSSDTLPSGITEVLNDAKLSLESRGDVISDEDFNLILEKRLEFMMKGFTPKNQGGSTHSTYKYVILMTSSDLRDLIDRLQALIDAEQSTKRRDELINVWTEAYQNNVGDITDSELSRMSFEEIEGKIQGYPINSNSLIKDKNLKCLARKRCTTDAEIADYIEQLEKKLETLKSIERSYPYSRTVRVANDEYVYFWIPQELLP